MKYKNLLLMLFAIISLSSCYSTYSTTTYKGNAHQESIGKSKNEILRSYGIPDRTMDDGQGGSVLIYEKVTQTTVVNTGGVNYGQSQSVGGAVYNSQGVLGASQTQSGSVSQGYGYSQTSQNKTFCNLFLDKNNNVYDFKSNYGALFDTKYYRCFNKTNTWLLVGASVFTVYGPIVTVPAAIIMQRKAKKKGEICH